MSGEETRCSSLTRNVDESVARRCPRREVKGVGGFPRLHRVVTRRNWVGEVEEK